MEYNKKFHTKNAYHDEFKLMKLCYCCDGTTALRMRNVVYGLCRWLLGLFAMNHLADTAPAKAATRNDDDKKANDNPHDNHSELAQTFETLFRWICDIVDDANERFVR